MISPTFNFDGSKIFMFSFYCTLIYIESLEQNANGCELEGRGHLYESDAETAKSPIRYKPYVMENLFQFITFEYG